MTKARPLTESLWLTCSSPYVMLRHLQQHERIAKVPGGKRRLRLLSVGLCRQVWEHFTDERCRAVIEAAERAADGAASRQELWSEAEVARAIFQTAERAYSLLARETPPGSGPSPAMCQVLLLQSQASAAQYCAATVGGVRCVQIVQGNTCMMRGHAAGLWQPMLPLPEVRQAALFHDVFGNPFGRPVFDEKWHAWNGGTVVRMAETIYHDRAFDRMPILADALEEAGCQDEAILRHGRVEKEHTRGCWVLDGILSR